MKEISNISNDAFQKHTIPTEDGTPIKLSLYFMPMQYMWEIRSLEYGDFKVEGLRVSNNINILRQFRNKLPFGISCQSTDDREPTFIDDFSSGASRLYLLDAVDVETVEANLSDDSI